MNLFIAEFSRLFARRFTRVMFLVILVLLGIIGAGLAASSHTPSPAATAKAKTQADQARRVVTEERADCEKSRADPKPSPSPSAEDGSGPGAEQQGRGRYDLPPGVSCAEVFDPSRISEVDYLPRTFSFQKEAHNMLLAFGGIFALLAFAVGASFVGAEWSSGGMTNLLIWRPRRLLVLSTKLVTLLLGLAFTGAVVAVAWIGALYGIASTRGIVGTVTQGSLTSLGLDTARALALALAAATIGFSLASLGRHTAMAMGVAVGYVVVIEIGLQILLRVAEVTKVERFFLSSYGAAWLNQKLELQDWVPCRYATGDKPCEPVEWTIDMADAATIFGIGTGALLVLAMIVMRRREIN